jgi:hypothetical protein
MVSRSGTSSGTLAILSAAAMLAGGISMTPANAADLGGNCCADLEERVAELEATTARKGNRRVSLTISGQVTTAIMAWDDGDNSDTYVVDNVIGGGTFFQLAGSAKINPDVTAGFQLAFSFLNGSRSHQVNAFDDDAGGADTNIVSHLSNWWIDHKSLGRLTVGRANTATAGITTIDLGGAGVIANASIGYIQRGFDDPNTGFSWNEWLGGVTVNGASLSRGNAIVYSTPTFGGFSASAAWGENDVWDVALRYAGEFSGFRVAAGIGYINNSSGTNEVTDDDGTTASGFVAGTQPSQVKGSASIQHVASGLFLTGAYLVQDNDLPDTPDTTLWYLQGGIAKNWTGLGNTVLYGEYARIEDGLAAAGSLGVPSPFSSEASMWGIGVVQHIDAAAMEVFLAYKQFGAEISLGPASVDADDFSVVVGGARIRF